MTKQINFQEYSGNYDDVCAFWNRVWVQEYAGKSWTTAADPAFFRWLVGPGSGAFCPAVYEDGRLIGNVFSVPRAMRAGSTVHSIGMTFGFTVDAKQRRVALPLVHELRRRSAERGIAFSIATVMSDPTSPSYLFWQKYAETFPDRLTSLFPVNYWAKTLAPDVVSRAAVQRWERTLTGVLGPLLSRVPFGRDARVRPYRPADLVRCADLVQRTNATCEWALLWSPDELRHRLESPHCETLVFEQSGIVRGLVNSHYVTMQGRESTRAAVIAMWADDMLTTMERIRFLGHFCEKVRARGAHVVVAPRSATMPATAFLANVFIPIPGPWHLAVFWSERAFALPSPKSWSLLVM